MICGRRSINFGLTFKFTFHIGNSITGGMCKGIYGFKILMILVQHYRELYGHFQKTSE